MSQPSPTRYRTDVLPAVVFSAFSMLTAVTLFWLPLYFSERLGFSGAQIGLLFAMQAVAAAAAALPAGLGADRVTTRRLVLGSLAVQSVALYLMGVATGFAAWMVVFTSWALMYNSFRLSMEMQLLKHDTGQRTAERTGRFVAWRFGGLTIGTLAAAWALGALDYQLTFKVAAILSLLLLVPAWFLPATKVSPIDLSSYARDLWNPRVILFVGWLFLFTTHWGVETTCYSLFLRKNMGLSLPQVGFYLIAEYVAVIFAAGVLGPRLLARDARLSRFVLLGLIPSGIGHIGMVVSNVWISVAFRALHGLGDGVIMIALYLGVTRLFNLDRLGGNAGAVNLAMTAGMIFGALIAGPAGEKLGYEVPFWFSGILLLVLAIPLIVKIRRQRPTTA